MPFRRDGNLVGPAERPAMIGVRPMKFAVLALLAMMLVGCSAQSADVKEDRGVAGTYELIICKGECSFSKPKNVIATAVVVLFDRMMTLKDMARIGPDYHYYTHDVNACYAVKLKAPAQSYAGVNRIGITPWVLDGHTIRFDLFHSPDAGYAVEVVRTGDVLAGTGTSWGAGMGAPPPEYTPDTIVGRRVGPADISKCANRTY